MEPKLCFVWLPHITKPVDQDNDDNDDDDDDDHAIVFHLLDDICNDSEIYACRNWQRGGLGRGNGNILPALSASWMDDRLQLLRLSLSDDGSNHVGVKEQLRKTKSGDCTFLFVRCATIY